MATWLDQLLAHYGQAPGGTPALTGPQSAGLLAAKGMGAPGTFDSSGSSGGTSSTFDSSGSGPETVPQSPAAAVQALLAGSMAYQKRVGHADPLGMLAEGRRRADGGVVGWGQLPVRQIIDHNAQGLNQVAQLTSHGPREGQAHTGFDLGNGLHVNVYYDDHGRRKTFVYHA